MKSYKNVKDTRPLDDWGKPIGKPYEKKDWEQLTPEEMMADFDWKSDILDSYGEKTSGATFYQDYLFKELYEEQLEGDYKVLLTSYESETNKIHKVDVDDIQDYLHMDDVALSPCLFFSNWRKKKLLNYVAAFVLDIDKLRPMQLQRFLRLFDEERLLRPTFIANSGSGVHFYYVLDKMLRCDERTHEANNLIAEKIYNCLYDDVKKKEKWKDAQKHWVGQDYRVVNSKTKLHQISQIFKTGELYTIEQLIEHYEIKVDRKKHFATKKMVKYASSIARDLKIDFPDFENAKETHEFIQQNKDEAYKVREQRRIERDKKGKKNKGKSKRPVTWYKNTLFYMQDHTQPGYRFSSMKALAIIAFKEKVPRDVFMNDIKELAAYWSAFDWKGDNFNQKNVAAIERLYDNAITYSNASAETLEEWLGYEFKRIGIKRNGRSRGEHLQADLWYDKDKRPQVNLCKVNRELGYKFAVENGKVGGRAENKVKEWRLNNPDGKKADCIRDTGLSKPTVYKWWDGETVKKAKIKKKEVFIPFNYGVKNSNSDAKKELLKLIMSMDEEKSAEFLKLIDE